jgi:hypothetical protein
VNYYYRIVSRGANLCLNCYWRRLGEHLNLELHSNWDRTRENACFTWNAQKCLFHVEQTVCERRSNVLIVRMQAFELAIHSNDFVSSLIALRQKYFRGGDGLAHVALGMFRDMDKKARYRGWQIFSADRARFLQRCGGCTEFAGAVGAKCENFCKCFKQLIARDFQASFTLQGRELLRSQRMAFGISEQTVEAAGDVTELKCNRGQAIRRGVQLRVR